MAKRQQALSSSLTKTQSLRRARRRRRDWIVVAWHTSDTRLHSRHANVKYRLLYVLAVVHDIEIIVAHIASRRIFGDSFFFLISFIRHAQVEILEKSLFICLYCLIALEKNYDETVEWRNSCHIEFIGNRIRVGFFFLSCFYPMNIPCICRSFVNVMY